MVVCGEGNPLQYSCLENPVDRGAWWAVVYGVAQSCNLAAAEAEEALQIAEKRTEAKGKGKKERYTHLNAEFQRIARKKAFLSDQCKETE